MNKSSISGWKDVFSFTFLQTIKSKSYIISFIIFVVLSTAIIPVVTLMTKSASPEDASTTTSIQKVYVNNETTFTDMDFSVLSKDKVFSKVSFETMTEKYDRVADKIEKDENTSVILTLKTTDEMYSLDLVKSNDGPVGDEDLVQLSDAVAKQFEDYKLSVLGITPDQQAMVYATVDTKVSLTDVDGTAIVKEDTSISSREYWFIYGFLFVVLMLNSIASAQVATSIVTEKSTRVMEYLLTSVKPLALIIGKIIAMLSAVLLQMISLVVMVFLSSKLSQSLIANNGENALSQYLPANVFDNINLINIIFCILFILLGLIFYATIAGLAGATVSRMEELQEGLTLFTLTNILGAYIGIAAIGILQASGMNGFVIFAYLCPLSSPFLLPGAIIAGKVGLPIVAASFALLIIAAILLFKFVAKVFEAMILHTGNKIKLKDMLKLSKN